MTIYSGNNMFYHLSDCFTDKSNEYMQNKGNDCYRFVKELTLHRNNMPLDFVFFRSITPMDSVKHVHWENGLANGNCPFNSSMRNICHTWIGEDLFCGGNINEHFFGVLLVVAFVMVRMPFYSELSICLDDLRLIRWPAKQTISEKN